MPGCALCLGLFEGVIPRGKVLTSPFPFPYCGVMSELLVSRVSKTARKTQAAFVCHTPFPVGPRKVGKVVFFRPFGLVGISDGSDHAALLAMTRLCP